MKRIRIPHVFILLTSVILFCSVLTYFIPSGAYQREQRSFGELTRTVVIPGTYEKIAKHVSLEGIVFGDPVEDQASPVSLLGFLTAIPRGMESASDIIFFIFIVGGVFGILQRTGTITAVIQSLLSRFSHSGPLLTVVLMVVIGIGGSTIGIGEELIPLVPIFLIVSQKLGYDRIYGFSLVYLSSAIGFAAATTNPFTVQIAQGIAEIPLGSGMPFRIGFFGFCMILALIYLFRYGLKIQKDPTQSFVAGEDDPISEGQLEKETLRASHIWIVVSCMLIFVIVLYAVQTKGWWLAEMSGGFLAMGLVATFFSKLSFSEAVGSFVDGLKDMVVAALVVGFARGIQVVLMDGQIMDSIIYYAATVLRHFSNILAAEGMLVFQSCLNFFIPSGSGQAAVTMPLMAPLSDVLGLTRQTAVFAFTCGDGFSNIVIPTSGVLMAMLSLAKIPYEKWLRFVFPLFLLMMLSSALFLAVAVWIGY
ncbi:putative basic amino acid antiporter YfcC [bacterium]|nr:putative basic amino acid antiporter YfcC [bacterium]